MKLDSEGNEEWRSSIGGSRDDVASRVLIHEGNFYLLGWTKSFGADGMDMFLAEFDSLGDLQWTRTYGRDGDEEPFAVTPISNNGFVLVGSTTSIGSGGEDVYFVETNHRGTLQAYESFGGTGNDIAHDVVEIPPTIDVEERYAVVGQSNGEAYILLLNADRELVREVFLTDLALASSLVVTLDLDLVIVGQTLSNNAYILKVDLEGTVLGTILLGQDNVANSVQETSDGGYLIGGTANTSPETSEMLVIKTDSEGN
ncbi:MAG: hypothetical protein CMG78_05835 [Marinobacter sp.]|nr:hypothetical protein [Marinobacter sp.]